MVAQDGVGFSGDVRPMLDNMIADGRLPAMAFVFADPGGNRSLEYIPASDKYYTFVENELLPAAIAQVMMQAKVVLNLTKDPEGRGTYGGSSGGAAAFTMGWFHPESYRRILTISGSFVNLQKTPPGFSQRLREEELLPDGSAQHCVPNVTPGGNRSAACSSKPARMTCFPRPGETPTTPWARRLPQRAITIATFKLRAPFTRTKERGTSTCPTPCSGSSGPTRSL